MADQNLTAERLREVLHYDPLTGVFTRLTTTHGGRWKAGTVAGCKSNPYTLVRVDGILYAAQRLAHLHETGSWPQFEVDHEDGDGHNNKWLNIRDVTHAVNIQNRTRLNRNNTSGAIGVSWCKRKRKWIARIDFNGRAKHLGEFVSFEDARLIAATARHESSSTVCAS